jgi:hypothetical protein
VKIEFVPKNFRQPALELIEKCNDILDRYHAEGYDMTLRQLYYQLVSAGEIPNNQREYNRLGVIVNDARLAGLIDWDYIVDRTRNVRSLAHWDEPSDILEAVSQQYLIDKWEGQEFRPEVWIEKDALAGVFERVCNSLDVPMFSCRGYTSQSEMYAASVRFSGYADNNQTPYILHFGDHDPSGMDMTRDIGDRLSIFETDVEVNRLALNFDQVEAFQPPPNPAKITDSRAKVYIKRFGSESWELDALPPDVLAGLVREQIESLLDDNLWQEAVEKENEQKVILRKISKRFEEVSDFLNK